MVTLFAPPTRCPPNPMARRLVAERSFRCARCSLPSPAERWSWHWRRLRGRQWRCRNVADRDTLPGFTAVTAATGALVAITGDVATAATAAGTAERGTGRGAGVNPQGDPPAAGPPAEASPAGLPGTATPTRAAPFS